MLRFVIPDKFAQREKKQRPAGNSQGEFEMQLAATDWIIIAAFFVISLAIGLWASRKAGRSFRDYFLAGGNMPWWLLGISMVATSFAADTPNLVTDIVRKNGVSGNWVWWAFLLTGMLTVFVYARLWKRSGVLTDLEFYEIRYSGRAAAVLRGFRSLYLGIVFNCMVMAVVILAGIKISGVLLGLSPLTTVLVAGSVTVFYTLVGGLRGVILTDCFQFIIAMAGAIAAAVFLCGLPEVGGLSNLLQDERVAGKLSLLPDLTDLHVSIPVLIIPLAVQWWSSWYPGAEPGGGGYVAQRMLGAKSESDATKATLLFAVSYYALRPWPWIIVALASLVVFPDTAMIQQEFPHIEASMIDDDLAYPAMLARLPAGLLGLVIASLIAAFMSTISTHLNWGSSYIAHDFYRRFLKPNASGEELVLVGQVSTIVLMLIASYLALSLKSALQGFNVILQIGAGTGLIYILRWFWWRINAWSEVSGMVASFLVALFFQFKYPELVELGWPELQDWQKLTLGVGITTAVWILVTCVTPPTDKRTLESFYSKIRPEGPGWKPVASALASRGKHIRTGNSLTAGMITMLLSTFLVYALLFGSGYFLYGKNTNGIVCVAVACVALFGMFKLWPNLEMDRDSKHEDRSTV